MEILRTTHYAWCSWCRMNIFMTFFLTENKSKETIQEEPIHCPKCREFLGRLNINEGFEVLCIFYDYLGRQG